MLNLLQSFKGQVKSFSAKNAAFGASGALAITISGDYEVFGVRGSLGKFDKIDVIDRDFRNSSGNSVFVEVVVLLVALESPFLIRPILVDLMKSGIGSIGTTEEVRSDHSTSLAAITAEAAVFPFGEIKISLS